MRSNFSLALITLFGVLIAAFLWAIAVFAGGNSIPLSSVNMHLALRNLFFCLSAFCLLWVTSQLPIRRPIIFKLMVGFGLLFVGAWHELLNTLVHNDWLLVRWLEIIALPGGLLAASLGLYELGKAYQLNRLLLGAYRKIEHNLATVDQLTQLHNRRYFFAMSPELMLSAHISGATPILLILRITNLQQINQKLGCNAGDVVLTKVAKLLLRHTRSDDITARLSGRHLVAFFLNSERPEVEAMIERLLTLSDHIGVTNEMAVEVAQKVELDYAICSARDNESFDALLERGSRTLLEQQLSR